MKQYDYKKSLNSGFNVFLQILGLGVIAFITNTPELVYLMPVTEIIRNYIKHN